MTGVRIYDPADGVTYRHPATDERVNTIRYPSPNRLGLLKPTPYIETITGRTMIVTSH